MLFTDVLFGVFGRLPDFYKNRSFYNNTVNYETRIENLNMKYIIQNLSKNKYDNDLVSKFYVKKTLNK